MFLYEDNFYGYFGLSGKYGEKMKTNAEQRFKELIKETVENTDFEDELKARIRELGYDKCPDIETLQKRAQSRKHERKRLRHSRALKIAAVVLAIFIVSSAMSIFANSNVALASRFAVHNFMFSLQNGFTSTDFQFYSTDMGRELVIDKEEQIPIGRNFLRELKTPKYIPANYSFVSLHVTNNLRNEYTVLFTYESDENTLILIRQQSLTLHNILDQIGGVQQDFFIDGDRIFFAPCVTTGNNTIFAFTSSDLIQISGILDLDDLVNIFKMLK